MKHDARPSHAPLGWCCIQAGHREKYGIPRALERVGVLDCLVTDLWAPPESLVSRLARGRVARRLRDRFSPGLPRERVRDFSLRALGWELWAGARGLRGDARTGARTAWWAALATRALPRALGPTTGFVFSYCYEAARPFELAATLGLTPVLGQIDPGPAEDRKVTEIVARWPQYRTPFRPGSAAYYAAWRHECQLAHHVVVNSEWSRRALLAEGVEAAKIVTLPLVYEPPAEAAGWQRAYPERFSEERPLRVLFLGQCILRKGIAETIGAAEALSDRPVEFTFVGNTDIADFARHFGRARIRHVPRVARADCQAFYRAADVFIFPTHSDGFGLTQLEAQAWKLPIVASRYCAEVVEDGVTGLILSEVAERDIVAALSHLLGHPAELARMSAAIGPWPFDLEQLGRELAALPPDGGRPS
jgi:glycosyltransferase involved in cell wall biosynthesis